MSRSLLCETVTAPTMAALLAARDAATADMVELRLDGVAGLDVDAALRGLTRPVVVTCRPRWEGGRFDGSEVERHGILLRALALGADYVDVEFAALHGAHAALFAQLVGGAPERIVLSAHDFDGVPADLAARARAMRGTGARTIKLAVTARRLTDVLPLREIGAEGNAVVIGMGDAGLVTRILAGHFGSPWTYAGDGVAPGQLPARQMLEQFRFRQLGPGTRLFGVVSASARHSLSPVMHNAAFAAAGLDAVYLPLQAADFDDFLRFADALGVEGASVTIPFKRDALQAAGHADALTRAVGAANTLRRRGGDWEATNTDVAGFLAPIDAALGVPLRGLRAAVMGAGGSARAVVVALLSREAGVTLHARRREQAQEVAAALPAAIGGWPVPGGSWDLLVNCTPLGGAAARDVSPLPGGPFTGRLVYDLTYGRGDSALLAEARAAGCAVLDGLPMLVAQAERQFEWWTGQPPAGGVMAAAIGRAAGTGEAAAARRDGVPS